MTAIYIALQCLLVGLFFLMDVPKLWAVAWFAGSFIVFELVLVLLRRRQISNEVQGIDFVEPNADSGRMVGIEPQILIQSEKIEKTTESRIEKNEALEREGIEDEEIDEALPPLFQIEPLGKLSHLKQIDRVVEFYGRSAGYMLVLTEFRGKGRQWLDVEDFNGMVESIYDKADVVFDTGFSYLNQETYRQRFLREIEAARKRYDLIICVAPPKIVGQLEKIGQPRRKAQYDVETISI